MAQERGQWGSQLGFVLAAAGSAIGLGNLWKFPFITWESKGGAFVLIYLICIGAVGFPIMIAEIMIGRKTQKSSVAAMAELAGKRFAWVGGLGVLTGFVIMSFYSVVAGWTLAYTWRCLGWSLNGFPQSHQAGDAFGAFVGSGATQVGLAFVFLLVTVSVVIGGVSRGIERVARTLMPTLSVILLLMLGSALTMSGAGEALRYIFIPRFDELSSEAVLVALGHAFFTLSLGMGAMITYGSYLGRRQSVVRASALVSVLDTVIALLATIIMFSVIFSKPGLEDSIGKSTAGMLFITLPELFYTVVPLGRVLAPLFYLLVGFAALTSTISLLEVVVAYFIDSRGMRRKPATLLCGGLLFVPSMLCALSLGAHGGLSSVKLFASKTGLFDTLDHLAANWMLPIGGLMTTLVAGWIISSRLSRAELVDETTPSWFSYPAWQFMIRFISPLAVLAILAAVIFFGRDFS